MRPEREYVFHGTRRVGLHRRLHADISVGTERQVELWAALAPSTRAALLALAEVMRRANDWPSAPLCVEVARQFDADAAVVCAGFGYLPPTRPATSAERLAWEVCRQVATATYSAGAPG